MSTEKSEIILKKLEANLPPAIVPPGVPSNETKEVQDDYEFSRKSYRDLVSKSNQAIESMLDLALQAEHPRAFEVLSLMLKNTSEITDKLMDLQKKKKNMKEADEAPKPGPQVGTQNVFIGSTTDLQKHLIAKLAEKNVTDTADNT
jgi:hypothetical protein